MRKIFSFTFLTLAIFALDAQDNSDVFTKKEPVLYTIGYNRVPQNFNLPLIGVINVAKGDHVGLQLGFANKNGGNFKGLAAGFANAVGGNMSGIQLAFFNATGRSMNVFQAGVFNAVGNSVNGCNIGLFNATGNSVNGLQLGLLNTTGNEIHGLQAGFANVLGNRFTGIQAGFLNVLGNEFSGIQTGFVNVTGNQVNGIQTGFVNVTGNQLNGAQFGFVNVDGNGFNGLQVGFFNKVYQVRGLQIGFINLVDTVKSGIPLGLFTYVKHGGYHVLEFGTSEMFPVNLAYKVGLPGFYTSLNLSLAAAGDRPGAVGAGLGTVLPLGKTVALNPDVQTQTLLFGFDEQFYTFRLNLLFHLKSHCDLLLGPDITWQHRYNNNDFAAPLYSFYTKTITDNDRVISGLSASIRYNFQ